MKRRTISATELRVHLGEALRTLESEELVIEKGGVPVAMLVRYRPAGEGATMTERERRYEAALGKRAEPGGWEKMDRAMAAGWAGIEPEELVANIYRWREEGRSNRVYSFNDEDEERESNVTYVPSGQRRLRERSEKTSRVADGDDAGYEAGGPRD